MSRNLSAVAKATGKQYDVEVYFASEGRSAEEHLEIARINAKPPFNRDPWHLDRTQARRLAKTIGAILDNYLQESMVFLRPSQLEVAFEKVGKSLVRLMKGNIKREKYKGSPKQLDEAYAIQKVRAGQSVHPMLIATGALIKALRSRVTKK